MSAAALLCLVVAISDGDTLKVRCGDAGAYQQLTIRLAEIDAPEKAQAFGQRSKINLSNLCYGTWARLRRQTSDRYGRMVARVECRGKDANVEQVRAGMAWAYTKYLTDQTILLLQQRARQERAGLWSDPNPIAPWDWRKLTRGR